MNNTNNIPRPVEVALPAGTFAHICWGETLIGAAEPTRRLTEDDIREVAGILVEHGCGTATAAAFARRWSNWWGKDFAPIRQKTVPASATVEPPSVVGSIY